MIRNVILMVTAVLVVGCSQVPTLLKHPVRPRRAVLAGRIRADSLPTSAGGA